MPGPGYYCSPTTALSFTLPCSTSPIFSNMSQESGTTSASSNLENQLADAMTVIQTLMVNVGNLTQQVVHLIQNVALMQANQNFPPPTSIPQSSPCNFPLPPSLLELAQDQALIYEWSKIGIPRRGCQNLLDPFIHADWFCQNMA